jgi:hypothetical protein
MPAPASLPNTSGVEQHTCNDKPELMKFSRRAYESGEIDWPLIFVAIFFCIYATWEIHPVMKLEYDDH